MQNFWTPMKLCKASPAMCGSPNKWEDLKMRLHSRNLKIVGSPLTTRTGKSRRPWAKLQLRRGILELEGLKKKRCWGITRGKGRPQTVGSGCWKLSSYSWCKSSMTGGFFGLSMTSWRLGSFKCCTRAWVWTELLGAQRTITDRPDQGLHSYVASRTARSWIWKVIFQTQLFDVVWGSYTMQSVYRVCA